MKNSVVIEKVLQSLVQRMDSFEQRISAMENKLNSETIQFKNINCENINCRYLSSVDINTENIIALTQLQALQNAQFLDLLCTRNLTVSTVQVDDNLILGGNHDNMIGKDVNLTIHGNGVANIPTLNSNTINITPEDNNGQLTVHGITKLEQTTEEQVPLTVKGPNSGVAIQVESDSGAIKIGDKSVKTDEE